MWVAFPFSWVALETKDWTPSPTNSLPSSTGKHKWIMGASHIMHMAQWVNTTTWHLANLPSMLSERSHTQEIHSAWFRLHKLSGIGKMKQWVSFRKRLLMKAFIYLTQLQLIIHCIFMLCTFSKDNACDDIFNHILRQFFLKTLLAIRK